MRRLWSGDCLKCLESVEKNPDEIQQITCGTNCVGSGAAVSQMGENYKLYLSGWLTKLFLDKSEKWGGKKILL